MDGQQIAYIAAAAIAGLILVIFVLRRANSATPPISNSARKTEAERNAYNDFLAGTITIDQMREKLIAAGTDEQTQARLLAEAPRLRADIRGRAAQAAAAQAPAEPLSRLDVQEHLKAFICGTISQAEFERPFVAAGMSRPQIDERLAGALKLRAMFLSHKSG